MAYCLVLFFLLLAEIAHVVSTPYRFTDDSEEITTADGRTSGIRDRIKRNFVLGGLIPVHVEDPNFSGGRCGKARDDQWVEAMLFAIDLVNANETLLPNITLGFDIRDTCFSDKIGQDEAFDLITAGNQLDAEACISTNMGSTNASATTVGMVGPGASRVSIPVAGLGRLFQVLTVSFGSTSPKLSNRERYPFFYRTVPSDKFQAQAMVDLILHFNWTEISIIYVEDAYGVSLALELLNQAIAKNICIDVYKEIGDNFGMKDYQELAETLLDSHADIVVLIAHEQNVEHLLVAITASSPQRRFTWIGSDGWARRPSLAHMFNETMAGYYGIAPHAPHVPSFDDYYSHLTVQTNKRNHWFADIHSAHTCNASNFCNPVNNLTALPQYVQNTFVPHTIDAVYAFANALHNYLKENCNFTSGWSWVNQSCPGQRKALNSSTLKYYLGKVDFLSPLTENRVTFDNNGSAAGNYEILNYQAQTSNGVIHYGFKVVGIWSNSRTQDDSNSQDLKFIENVTLQFGVNSSGGIIFQPPITLCGRCPLGKYRRLTDSCCDICDPCLGRDYSDDPTATSCKTCSNFTWGNNPTEGSSYCESIPETYLQFKDAWSIVLLLLAIFGLLGVIITSVLFAIYWNTPVIKSSGREQMVILLIGITLSFIMPFIFISPPVLGVCVVRSVGFWLALSLMFGALLVKIVRVARIFFNKASLTHLRFTEFYYQILFTLALVLVQMIIVAAAIAYEIPERQKNIQMNLEDNNKRPVVVIYCSNISLPFLIISVLYESAIIVAATILGVLSFKYPANFNEARYVSFCTFAVCVIWVAFVVTYIAVQEVGQKFRNAITSLGIVMTAFAFLATIFGRKVFIVVFWRKKNVATLSTQHGHSRTDRRSIGDEHTTISNTVYDTTTTLKLSTLEPKLSTLESNSVVDKENKIGKGIYFLHIAIPIDMTLQSCMHVLLCYSSLLCTWPKSLSTLELNSRSGA